MSAATPSKVSLGFSGLFASVGHRALQYERLEGLPRSLPRGRSAGRGRATPAQSQMKVESPESQLADQWILPRRGTEQRLLVGIWHA